MTKRQAAWVVVVVVQLAAALALHTEVTRSGSLLELAVQLDDCSSPPLFVTDHAGFIYSVPYDKDGCTLVTSLPDSFQVANVSVLVAGSHRYTAVSWAEPPAQGIRILSPTQGHAASPMQPIQIRALLSQPSTSVIAQVSWEMGHVVQTMLDTNNDLVYQTELFNTMDPGTYEVIVIADGIASNPVRFNVHTDLAHSPTGLTDILMIGYAGNYSHMLAEFMLPPEVEAQVFSRRVRLHELNRPIPSIRIPSATKSIRMLELFDIVYDGALELGLADIKIYEAEQAYAIDPTLVNFSYGIVTVQARGSQLYKCRLWNMSEMRCDGDWAFEQHLQPGEDYTILLTPDDPAFAEMRIQQCWAMDRRTSSGSWLDPCDNIYPGPALFYDDTTYEVHRVGRQGSTNYWAGIRINSTNASLDTCDEIASVSFCYKWWSGTANLALCDISVDADRGASYSPITTACPGTSEPLQRTCVNVTSLESWDCSNFFGSSPKGAMAKSELRYSGGGQGNFDITWDIFYFNVSFINYAPAWSGNTSSIPSVYSPTQPSLFNITWTDNDSIETVYFESNFSGEPRNYSMSRDDSVYSFSRVLPAGSFYWRSHANDSLGQWNTTRAWYFTIFRAEPILGLYSHPAWQTVYGTTTNVTCYSHQVTPGLYRNGLLLPGLSDAALLGAGQYSYTCNATASQNYTSASVSNQLNITRAPGTVNLFINGSRNNRTIIVGQGANLTALLINGTGSITVYNNGSVLYAGAPPYSNVTAFQDTGLYNITAVYEGNGNYTAAQETWWLNVSLSQPPDLPPQWSGNTSSVSEYYDPLQQSVFEIKWIDDNYVHTVLFESNHSGTARNYSMSLVGLNTYSAAVTLPAGSFYWRSHANDSAGNWSTSPAWSFSVAKATPELLLHASPSWAAVYGTETNVSCSADTGQVNPELFRNSTPVPYKDIAVLAAGGYNYSCTSAETANYTAALAWKMLNISRAEGNISLYLKQERQNTSIYNNSFLEIDAVLVKGTGAIAVHVNGTQIYSGSSPYYVNRIFNSTGLYNITASSSGDQNYTPASQTWWVNVIPAPLFAQELPIQTCWAQDARISSGSWLDPCDNTYPGPGLFYDDSTLETHRVRRQGGSYYWAGIRINSSNSSVFDCQSILSVSFCYKWWAATTALTSCDISVDADGGASYYAVTNTCPTGSEPATWTCVDVTAAEDWQCENFFGPTGAMAKSELLYNGGTNAYFNVYWDVFFFNVSYEKKSYTLYYGNVSSQLSLGLSSSILKTYGLLDVINIYASDFDSMINYSAVQALGRKKDNTTSANDFAKADQLLGISGKSDSISALWSTDGTTPRNTATFFVYGRPIPNVPIINSTTTSAFITGILWDTSDSSDDAFDTEDAEDLVFVTKYNESQLGKYGLYSYELTVPYTLADHKGTTSLLRFDVDSG